MNNEINSIGINKKPADTTVVVAMSGGVDSSTVAREYDGYVAEPRANEWDIAAGHAILKHAGGSITDFDNNEIIYGKKNFKNTSIILKSKNIL